jgi:nitroreductase
VSWMSFEQLVGARHSCRAFLPDDVPGEVVEGLFALAQLTPSWCNTQPWQVHLLQGEVLARFGRDLLDHVARHDHAADLGMPTYQGEHASRRRESGHALYAALGIDRQDHVARRRQALRNFSFFGAPYCGIVTTDRALGTYGAIDCGAYLHTLMLGARSLGLGSIAQGALAMYSDFVRQWLRLPDDRLVVCGFSFGYADLDDPVNDFRTTRASLSAVVHRVDATDRAVSRNTEGLT